MCNYWLRVKARLAYKSTSKFFWSVKHELEIFMFSAWKEAKGLNFYVFGLERSEGL